jgi:hypothetical protein
LDNSPVSRFAESVSRADFEALEKIYPVQAALFSEQRRFQSSLCESGRGLLKSGHRNGCRKIGKGFDVAAAENSLLRIAKEKGSPA